VEERKGKGVEGPRARVQVLLEMEMAMGLMIDDGDDE
jgi:hypothetical protein